MGWTDPAVAPRDTEVGGCDLAVVAERFGTPAYVYDEQDLRARAREFVAAAGEGAVFFAAKALPVRAVLALFAEEGLGASVASEGELRLALAAGIEPERVLLHGHAASADVLGLALDAGVHRLVVDGLDVAERAERVASERGATWDVLLRVVADVPAAANTRFDAETGQIDLKAGIPLHRGEAAAAVRRLRASDHLRLRGLHQHFPAMMADARLPALARLADLHDGVVNAGGGPAIGDDIAAHVAAVRRVVQARVEFEPGASLVGPGGLILYRVVGVRRGVRTYAVLDGGLATDARPLLYGLAQEAAVLGRDGAAETVSLAGASSEPGDVLAWDAELPAPREGDLVVTPNAGAYAYALASRFDVTPRAPVVLCRDGEARAVVARESWEDLVE